MKKNVIFVVNFSDNLNKNKHRNLSETKLAAEISEKKQIKKPKKHEYVNIQFSELGKCLNPIALRMAKTLWCFGHSE